MPYEIGFDREKYIQMQSEHIQKRRAEVGGKLYLEMGGKLFDDNHASRVLPGFTPDNKIAMLDRIKDEVEIVICFNAGDVVRQKMRADLGITYEDDVLRLVDVFRDRGFLVENVVVTQLEGHNRNVEAFVERLARLGLKVSRHYMIAGYPNDTEKVVSEEGFGRNDYVETSRDLVVMTAPGPGSGKLATCLSQVYHEHKRGIDAGYAKFETFPIWNLPLSHPVNLAYEAATADLDDINVIDQYHLEAYGEKVSSYNRDIDVFPLLKTLLREVTGSDPYQSPTDMGVNMAGYCISDDAACRHAAEQEIIRRYYAALVDERRADADSTVSDRNFNVMRKADLSVEDRVVVSPALEVAERTGKPGAALELPDGRIVTGKTSDLLGPSAAVLLNALKLLAGIDDDVHLLSPDSIEPIQTLKTRHLGSVNPRLHTDEVLIALSVSASGNPDAALALEHLRSLRGCDAHITTILGSVDEGIFRNLGVLATSEPKYWRKALYHKR
ncbi:DUF1846 domain-containing protein [Corynebacterium sp. MSK008]|uniref:DUF1846 domain-containing protein n=1 Tax=Corynebacterium sp. MSK008 TaxID=3050188 RepID=UPI00254A37D8|nr:DUF1846 domain-containing protein [Corynebacterium sp. MSK008]MDK8878770.1 DUF1846 domain-containing protein [Corynebacterium sp. MSK008]